MKEFLALLRKDCAVELRMKETLSLIIAMSLLMGVIGAVGINGAFISGGTVRVIFPTLFWLSFLFASTLSVSRSFEYEFRDGALLGTLMTGVSPHLVFLSKFIVNVIAGVIGLATTFITLSVLLNVEVLPIIGDFALISILVIVGFVGISTLLIPISFGSKLRGMLLPLLLLPLLFPVLFAGLELSAALFDGIPLDIGSPWVSLLIGFDVIYVTLGMNMFEQVVCE